MGLLASALDDEFVLARQVFLGGMCLVHLASFASWLAQLEGLVGLAHGVEPLRAGAEPLSLLRVAHAVGVPAAPDAVLQAVVAGGVALAAAGVASARVRGNAAAHVALFAVSRTLAGEGGGSWAHYQWELLLLESGALAVLYAAAGAETSATPRLLARWLLVRLMLSSGAVKLLARDASWWDLSACRVHHETTCAPHVGAFWAFQLPAAAHRASCAAMFAVELVAPWLALLPTRAVRHACAALQAALQIAIMASGNYGFFNLNTLVLCVPLVDDSVWARMFRCGATPAARRRAASTAALRVGMDWRFAVRFVINLSVLLSLAALGVWLRAEPRLWSLNTLSHVLAPALRCALALGAAHVLLGGVAVDMTRALLLARRGAAASRSVFGAAWRAMRVGAVALAAVAILLASSVAFAGRLHRPTAAGVPLASLGMPLYNEYLAPLRLVAPGSYGLFARMTTTRDELAIEACFAEPCAAADWRPLRLPVKPNDAHSLAWPVVPHMPRLDWRLWFAALTNGQSGGAWVLHLVWRLLESRESATSVAALFGESVDALPWPAARVRVRRRRFTKSANIYEPWHVAGPPTDYFDLPRPDDGLSLAEVRRLIRVGNRFEPDPDQYQLVHLSRPAVRAILAMPWAALGYVVLFQIDWRRRRQQQRPAAKPVSQTKKNQ